MGSTANTSRAAPATRPDRIASASASSSTMPPREVLMIRSPGRARARRSRPIRPTVSFDLATCRVMKSAWATRSSRATSSIPSWRARSGDTYGSWAMSRIPKASARWATSAPTRPRPTMPSVLPWSSTPSQRLRSHLPPIRAAWAWGMLRAWARSSAMVCSAADRMLDCGALTTVTPRAVAAATSTLSRPIPARPTTTRSRPASMTPAVTCVADRTISACAPATAASSPVGSRSSRTSTSWPAW